MVFKNFQQIIFQRDFTAQLIEARTNIARNEEYHQFDDYESDCDQPQGKNYTTFGLKIASLV